MRKHLNKMYFPFHLSPSIFHSFVLHISMSCIGFSNENEYLKNVHTTYVNWPKRNIILMRHKKKIKMKRKMKEKKTTAKPQSAKRFSRDELTYLCDLCERLFILLSNRAEARWGFSWNGNSPAMQSANFQLTCCWLDMISRTVCKWNL